MKKYQSAVQTMKSDKTLLALDSKNVVFVRQCAKHLVHQARDTNCNVVFTVLDDQVVGGVYFHVGDRIFIDPGKPIQEGAIVCALVDGLPTIDLAGAPRGEVVGAVRRQLSWPVRDNYLTRS